MKHGLLIGLGIEILLALLLWWASSRSKQVVARSAEQIRKWALSLLLALAIILVLTPFFYLTSPPYGHWICAGLGDAFDAVAYVAPCLAGLAAGAFLILERSASDINSKRAKAWYLISVSFLAVGLMGYLLSKPDPWVLRMLGLIVMVASTIALITALGQAADLRMALRITNWKTGLAEKRRRKSSTLGSSAGVSDAASPSSEAPIDVDNRSLVQAADKHENKSSRKWMSALRSIGSGFVSSAGALAVFLLALQAAGLVCAVGVDAVRRSQSLSDHSHDSAQQCPDP